MNSYWLPIALFGAFIYGSFSFLLSFLDKKIKNNYKAQIIFGALLNFPQLILYYILFFIWYLFNKDKIGILIKNINWIIAFITIIFDLLTNPIHALVINAGGSVGQQTMYSLTIFPVIILGYFFLKQKIKIRQIIGILVASFATFLMY